MNAAATKMTISLDGPYLDIISLRQSGLCCSQIIVKLVLADLGRDNPDLVRGVAGLCFGGGHLGRPGRQFDFDEHFLAVAKHFKTHDVAGLLAVQGRVKIGLREDAASVEPVERVAAFKSG